MAVLRAMGEPTRLRMLRVLLRGPLGVNGVAERIGVSPYNASKHLRILREAGLLESTRQGKLRVYRMAAGVSRRLRANRNVLELKCCTLRFDKLPR